MKNWIRTRSSKSLEVHVKEILSSKEQTFDKLFVCRTKKPFHFPVESWLLNKILRRINHIYVKYKRDKPYVRKA